MLGRIPRRIRSVSRPGFGQDVVDVVRNGVEGDDRLYSYLQVGLAGGDEPQHLYLALGSGRLGRWGPPLAGPEPASAVRSPVPSKAASPARWRGPGTRPAETRLSPGRRVGARHAVPLQEGIRRSRSKSRPARAGSQLSRRRRAHPRSGSVLGQAFPWCRRGAPKGGRPMIPSISSCLAALEDKHNAPPPRILG